MFEISGNIWVLFQKAVEIKFGSFFSCADGTSAPDIHSTRKPYCLSTTCRAKRKAPWCCNIKQLIQSNWYE